MSTFCNEQFRCRYKRTRCSCDESSGRRTPCIIRKRNSSTCAYILVMICVHILENYHLCVHGNVASSTSHFCLSIAYLLDASDDRIGYCIRNMTGTVTGMICDGGKVGCKIKGVYRFYSCTYVVQQLLKINNTVLRRESDGIYVQQQLNNVFKIWHVLGKME